LLCIQSLPLAPKELVNLNQQQMLQADEKQQRNIHDLVTRPSDANLHKMELIMDFIVDFMWDKMRGWCHIDKDDEVSKSEGNILVLFIFSPSSLVYGTNCGTVTNP
jgi:hypothetical protein